MSVAWINAMIIFKTAILGCHLRGINRNPFFKREGIAAVIIRQRNVDIPSSNTNGNPRTG